MTPIFILPAGYASRTVELVLTRESRGWSFCGRADGYCVPARYPDGTQITKNAIPTRQRACDVAAHLGLPAFAVWNGRKRRYDGKGAEFIAVAREN